MGKEVKIELGDFASTLYLYMVYNKLTQEEFAKRILGHRQAVASLRTAKLEEVTEGMLFRLYFYFNEQSKKQDNGIELELFKMVSNELENRINSSEKNNDKKQGRPRVRRKNK